MSTARVDPPQEPPGFRPEDRRHELARVLRRKRRLRAGTVQLLGVAAAIGLAFLVPQVHIGFDIPTTRAIEMLIAVGVGTVTFIGIVFSLLFLVVQFASTTFTPRLNLFRDDPIVWRAFAFYTAVVVYSFTAALVIGGDEKTSATVPIVAFALWFAASPKFREFTLSLNPQNLTLFHSWRVIGVVFVILEAHRMLPAVFAFPAGYGDIFIGATAGIVAARFTGPSHRATFITWQLLGIFDLLNAVALGITAGLIDPHGASMLPMTVLPLSLVPTFGVPLLMIVHIIAIAQARSWKREPASAPHVVALSQI